MACVGPSDESYSTATSCDFCDRTFVICNQLIVNVKDIQQKLLSAASLMTLSALGMGMLSLWWVSTYQLYLMLSHMTSWFSRWQKSSASLAGGAANDCLIPYGAILFSMCQSADYVVNTDDDKRTTGVTAHSALLNAVYSVCRSSWSSDSQLQSSTTTNMPRIINCWSWNNGLLFNPIKSAIIYFGTPEAFYLTVRNNGSWQHSRRFW